ncbi:uncharacterized protein LOC34620472 [Cyclospora cayetanensis]|uniref:Uncharacterized protein LOC34620472 n=1 Tax=Cyclospora cayetanensis TaxID=88456 RepID=A0A6P6RY43_9EIME|nr:uncharacterized protein LOC34620472 [Cyclospora cayetanensis]
MVIARTLQLRRTRLEWLTRRLALSGGMSRREALAAIEKGAVQVEGRTATRDVEVCDEADISFKGQRIPASAALPALFGMHKPPRVACTYTLKASGPTLKSILAQVPPLDAHKLKEVRERPSEDSAVHMQAERGSLTRVTSNEWHREEVRGSNWEAGRNAEAGRDEGLYTERQGDGSLRACGTEKTINSSTNGNTLWNVPGHLIPVNYLPLHAEGLVLLTNDGGFAHALRNPLNKIVTAYDFRVSGQLPSMELWRQWAMGVCRDGVDYGRVWVQLLRPCPSGGWLRLKLVEPPGADFRSLLGSCGLKIRRVRLYSFGPYMSSSVPAGPLIPLPIDQALLPLAPVQRPRLMLVPLEGEIQATLDATAHLGSLKGGGFPAARLLKENSALANQRLIKAR